MLKMSLTWIFQGSTYELHKTPKSFNEAAQAAEIAGSYLAEINSEEENNAIFQQVLPLISTEEFASTTSRDGGGAAYVWIGGSDQDSEGNWQWINSRRTIPLTRSEWGSGALGSEPDGGTSQNGLGLGLENWLDPGQNILSPCSTLKHWICLNFGTRKKLWP